MMGKRHRQTRIDDDVAFVPLSQGEEALIDVIDVPLVEEHTWSFQRAGNKAYAITWRPTPTGKQRLFMHRVILGHYEAIDGKLTDHINHNGLDNRKVNLRAVSPRVNALNQRSLRKTKSGYRSVYPSGRYWAVQIHDGERLRYMGSFRTIEEAAEASDLASLELRPGLILSSSLNFPERYDEYAAKLTGSLDL